MADTKNLPFRKSHDAYGVDNAGNRIYSQEMFIRGEKPPAWFRENRDHVYSTATDDEVCIEAGDRSAHHVKTGTQ